MSLLHVLCPGLSLILILLLNVSELVFDDGRDSNNAFNPSVDKLLFLQSMRVKDVHSLTFSSVRSLLLQYRLVKQVHPLRFIFVRRLSLQYRLVREMHPPAFSSFNTLLSQFSRFKKAHSLTFNIVKLLL